MIIVTVKFVNARCDRLIGDQILLSYIKQSRVFNIRQNKSEILAALSNPVNMELKQQLIENLDRQYQTDEYTNPEAVEEVDVDNTSDDMDNTTEEVNEPTKEDTKKRKADESNRSSSTSSKTSKTSESPSDTDTSESGTGDESMEDVQETTDINGDMDIFSEEDVAQVLNENESTDGVNYVQIKPQENHTEIWIMYHDTVNVSDILSYIINAITSEFPDWQFNRVARTYNAVIFVSDEKEDDVIE